MKRSEINSLLRHAEETLARHQFHLPPWAHWTPSDWKKVGPEAREIKECMLGWDLTDFGSGDFGRVGLLLFTIRNGNPSDPRNVKTYAEKIMLVRPGQITPMHFHWAKMEDIINRGGGDLVIQLHNATSEEDLDKTNPVQVSVDGIVRSVPAGGTVVLTPGESISIPRGLYHKFWGDREVCLVGEVSMTNDDKRDNRFHQPAGRFPRIEEDEAPLRLLCTEYPALG